MDGFSVISLTSLLTTISSRLLSSIEELSELVAALEAQGNPVPILLDWANDIRVCLEKTAVLESTLGRSTVVSRKMQTSMSQSLRSCEGVTAVLSKKIMRLQPNVMPLVSEASMKTYLGDDAAAVQAHGELFALFTRILAKTDNATQDAAVDAPDAQVVLQKVEAATVKASAAKESVLEEAVSSTVTTSEKGALPGVNDEAFPPPAYEASAASPTQPADGEPSSSKSGFAKGLSSLTSSFKAMASALRPKPDPLACALCQAALRGDLAQMKGLIGQGAKIDGRNEEGNTPMNCAVLSNNSLAVELLLASGAAMESSDWSKLPPLFLAASVGNIDVVNMLIGKGANPNLKNWSGQAYFYEVVSSENIAGIRTLLQHGANPQTQSISGQQVIVKAVKRNNAELVLLLLQHGASANTTDISGGSVLGIAASQDNMELFSLLLDNGANPNTKTISGSSLLSEFISRRRLDMAYLLLERGADANGSDIHGTAVLLNVVQNKKFSEAEKTEAVRKLLSYGANPNCKDAFYQIPVINHAMELGNSDIIMMLLRHGAKTDKKMERGGETLLLYAMDRDKMDQAKLLINHGADPNATDKKGRTPLMQAMVKHNVELVRLLRARGADIKATGQMSAADLAILMNNPEVFQALGMKPPAQSTQTSSQPPQQQPDPARPQSPPPDYAGVVGKQ